MTFKEDMAEDLPTFLATDEFACEVEVDGVKMSAQVIRSTRDKSQRLQEQFEPLFGDFTTIYFKTEEFLVARGKVPAKGDRIFIDNNRFEVAESRDEQGITKLICSAYRQPKPRLGDFRRD